MKCRGAAEQSPHNGQALPDPELLPFWYRLLVTIHARDQVQTPFSIPSRSDGAWPSHARPGGHRHDRRGHGPDAGDAQAVDVHDGPGQPVNHHLEADIYDRASGAVLDSVMPDITITNQATNASRTLNSVMACTG